MITTPEPSKVVLAAVAAGVAWFGARAVGDMLARSITEDNELLTWHGSDLRRRADPYADLARKLPPAASDRLLLARSVVRGTPIAYKLHLTPHGIQADHGTILRCHFDHVGVQDGVATHG